MGNDFSSCCCGHRDQQQYTKDMLDKLILNEQQNKMRKKSKEKHLKNIKRQDEELSGSMQGSSRSNDGIMELNMKLANMENNFDHLRSYNRTGGYNNKNQMGNMQSNTSSIDMRNLRSNLMEHRAILISTPELDDLRVQPKNDPVYNFYQTDSDNDQNDRFMNKFGGKNYGSDAERRNTPTGGSFCPNHELEQFDQIYKLFKSKHQEAQDIAEQLSSENCLPMQILDDEQYCDQGTITKSKYIEVLKEKGYKSYQNAESKLSNQIMMLKYDERQTQAFIPLDGVQICDDQSDAFITKDLLKWINGFAYFGGQIDLNGEQLPTQYPCVYFISTSLAQQKSHVAVLKGADGVFIEGSQFNHQMDQSPKNGKKFYMQIANN